MNQTIFIKRHDSSRVLQDNLTYSDGSVIDLTDSEVKLVWNGLAKNADILTAESGSVSYALTNEDVANEGTIYLEWRIVFDNGSVLTVPTDNRIVLRILEDLFTGESPEEETTSGSGSIDIMYEGGPIENHPIRYISSTNIQTISIPNLVQTTGGGGDDLEMGNNAALTSISIPLVSIVAGTFAITENPLLPSVSFPSLTSTGTLAIESNVILTTISVPLWSPTNGSFVYCDGNALDVESVDHILSRCVANAEYVSGTIDLSGGTNAAPSSVGEGSDYETLVNRGVSVVVNS